MITYVFRRGVLFFSTILGILLVLVAIYAHINQESFSFTYFRVGLAALGLFVGLLIYVNHKNEEYLKPRHERIFLLSFAALAFFLVGALWYLTYTSPFPGKDAFLLFVKIPIALSLSFGIYTLIRFREASDLPAYYAVIQVKNSLWRGAVEAVLSITILLLAFYCIHRILPDFTSAEFVSSTSASSSASGPSPDTAEAQPDEATLRGAYAYNRPSVRENPEERFRLCTDAARYGDAVAQNDLGIMYLTGNGTPQNIEKGIYWLSSAASQELSVAEFNLGSLFLHGRFVPRDDAKAHLYFLRLSQKGLPQGHYFLGALYYEGRGVEKDPERALGYFRQAAEKEYPAAEFRLGSLYLEGVILDQDIQKGLISIERSAIRGYAPAQWRMGTFFREGAIVLKNPIEAQKWFLLAASQGYEKAVRMSKILGRELEEDEEKIAAALAALLNPRTPTTSR